MITLVQQTPRLDRVQKNLERKQYLRDIGEAGTADIKRNFSTQGSNIGRSWPPLKWREGGQRLRDDEGLMRSIHPEVSGDKVEVVATKTARSKKGRVNIAAVQHYGAKIKVTRKMFLYLGFARGIWLKKGTKHLVIPATKFMTFSKRFRDEAKKLAAKVFQ